MIYGDRNEGIDKAAFLIWLIEECEIGTYLYDPETRRTEVDRICLKWIREKNRIIAEHLSKVAEQRRKKMTKPKKQKPLKCAGCDEVVGHLTNGFCDECWTDPAHIKWTEEEKLDATWPNIC